MKPKWKCTICDKILATKQNIEKHIEKLHPDSDKTQKLYMVVQMASDEDKSDKKQSKGKSAYSFFSGMKNIFSQKDLCKDLTLYPHANDKNLAVQTLKKDEYQNTEAVTVQDISKDDENIPKICEAVKSPPPPANLETHFEFFISELDTAFEESPPPTPSGEGVSREALPLVELQYLNLPPPIPGVVKFKPPFKTRGGCGCEKCNRKNCGNCYNCLNRSKSK